MVSPYELNPALQFMNPALWIMLTGSVVIAREDRKPLHIAHSEALVKYCGSLGYTWETLHEVGPGDPKRDLRPESDITHQASSVQLLSHASKTGYLEYFAAYMNAGGRMKHGDIGSPYDI
jgi:hypothetical protein